MSAENSINVSVRVRPLTEHERLQVEAVEALPDYMGEGNLAQPVSPSKPRPTSRRIIDVLDNRVLVFDPAERDNVRAFQNGPRIGIRQHKDKIYGEQSIQDDIFKNTTKPLLDGVLNGYNATVFAYGATGCGKTYTISGTSESPGLIYLTMADLFRRIDEYGTEKTVKISLSYLEIYNENIRDLLTEEAAPRGGLALREDVNNRMTIPNLSEHHPQTPEEVNQLIQAGNARRTQSPTMANATSSRSHAVLQINVRQKERSEDDMTIATLSIIDLAGSERASVTQNSGLRLHEGANINKSLLALGNCINTLCEGKRNHVPYRNSKLTRLLKFSLGGNCKTVMIVCVSPYSAHYEETLNTLKYANRAKEIKTKVSRNTLSADTHVREYVRRIAELQEHNRELKFQLDQGRSTDSDQSLRRKQQAELEVDRAIGETMAKFHSSRAALSEKGSCEASLAAAQSYIGAMQAKIDAIGSADASTSTAVAQEQGLLQLLTSAERFMVGPGSAIAKRFEVNSQSVAMFEAGLKMSSDRRFEKVDDVSAKRFEIMCLNWQLQAENEQLTARERIWKQSLSDAHAKLAVFAALAATSTVTAGIAASNLTNDAKSAALTATKLSQLAETNSTTFRTPITATTQIPVATPIMYAAPGAFSSPEKLRKLTAPVVRPYSPLKAVRLHVSPRKPATSMRRRSLINKTASASDGAEKASKSLRWKDEFGDALCEEKSKTETTDGSAEWIDEEALGVVREEPAKQNATKPSLVLPIKTARRSLAAQPLALRKLSKSTDGPFQGFQSIIEEKSSTTFTPTLPTQQEVGRAPFADLMNQDVNTMSQSQRSQIPSYAASTAASRLSARPSLSVDNKHGFMSSQSSIIGNAMRKPRMSLQPGGGSSGVLRHSPHKPGFNPLSSSLSSQRIRSPGHKGPRSSLAMSSSTSRRQSLVPRHERSLLADDTHRPIWR